METRSVEAFKAAQAEPSREALLAAFDAAFHVDAWERGLTLVEMAREAHPNDGELLGVELRALWRGGRIRDADELAERISPETRDRAALAALIQVYAARGEMERALRFADRLEKLGPRCAMEFYLIADVRMGMHRLDGVAGLLRRAAEAIDAAAGYPDTLLEDSLIGVPELIETLDGRAFNQIASFGKARMERLIGFGLLTCEATIDGHGPYTLLIDTGGSVAVSLDKQVADEIGIKIISKTQIRGIGGAQESGQGFARRVEIGEIACEQVMVQSFELPAVLMGSVDGVLGTGVFADGRLTLDLGAGTLRVVESSGMPATGNEVESRVVADAKLISAISVNSESGWAVVDSGASAAVMSLATAHKLFPTKELEPMKGVGAGGVGDGESSAMVAIPLFDLQFAGHTFKDLAAFGFAAIDKLLNPILGVQTQMVIGMPTIREMRSLTVDYPRRRVWVDWIGAGSADEVEQATATSAPASNRPK